MDSQDDSIDIAKLQRVALGLEHEQSQSVLDKLRTIGEASQDTSKTDHPDQAVFLASLSSAPRRDYRTSTNQPRARSRSRPLSPSSVPNATKQGPSGPREHDGESVSQPGKMSSAETAPGDTQVVSQSVFDSIIRQNQDSSGVEGLASGGNGTFMTLREGDTGHIDLLSGFDNTHPDVMHSEENEDENGDQSSSKLGESSPTHYEPNLFPESQRFLASTPARPATQNRADARPTETPRASRNPLAVDAQSSGGIMSLSQVFKATQVPSSPLVNNGPQSEPMSDRPSPNIPLHNHALAGALSSPSMSMPAKLNGKSPEAPYISMEESQAERDKLLGLRMTRSAEHIVSEDQSDGEFNKEPSFVRRLRHQRAIDEEATAQFASLAAPARPSSSRSATKCDRPTPSPREEPEKAEQDESRRPVLGYEEQETGSVNQHGGTSEEETEQEEDLDRPVHPSQRPQSSTEDDKENCNDPSVSNIPASTSSHDRLTQALGLSENQSQHPGPLEQGPADSHHPRSPNLDEQVSTSSQPFIVKDSQQSPNRQDNENCEETLSSKAQNEEMQKEETSGDPSSRMETDRLSDIEKVPSSPIMKPPPQSSPPSSRRRRDAADAQNTDTADHTWFENSYDSSNKYGEGMSSRHDNHPRTSDPRLQESTDVPHNPQGKSSSLLSQIAETPLDLHPRSSRDTAASNVPETSPNRFLDQPSTGEENAEPPNQEDDDLPPMYPAAHERASQSGPSDAQRPAPAAKNILNPKIFSSPSGRARRTLTEIASDPSPQPWSGNYDMNFDILTTEDQEFNSMVANSPIPPKKKRRRNIDLNIYARDPIFPRASQTAKPQAARVQQDATIESEPAELASMAGSAPVTQSSPPRRPDAVSDVDVLRRSNVRRVGRPPKSARRRGRPPGHARKRPMNEVAVVIHNNLSSSASKSLDNPPPRPRDNDQRPMDTSADDIPADPLPPFSDGSQILQNQVLAIWSGQKRAYYAGTCFGAPPGTTPSRYLVRFEDSAAVEVPTSSVKKMELNVGDGVKVDMPSVPKITHIIRGFADRLDEEEMAKQAASGVIPLTDIHGHSTVVLGPKQRKNLPGGGLVGPETVITVPMSKIYLDTILWNQLKGRDFTFNPETTQLPSRRAPSERQSTPASPSTRTSRNMHPFAGPFSGMAFAVSYTEDEDVKSRITKLILENGGRILKDGFNELFQYTSTVPLVSSEPSDNAAENSEPFQLTNSAEEIGFACLIADKHSRREKYMQALALNLPCLSGRWIEDCTAQRRVLDWGMYLLPAGESLYLDGATKSRLLPPTAPANARLADTVMHRPNLLSGQSVLLVMGRGRAEEKRKAYIFLTYALGASRMERVFDLKSAKAVLDRQGERRWDWIYVDDDEQDAARAVILGESTEVPQKTQQARRGRKRKMPAGPVDSNGGGMKGRIMGNEFLCQSLILGRLFE